jgi:hypothetical protein
VREPPNERRWTEIGAVIIAVVFAVAGVTAALIPVNVETGDGAECGTAFFNEGPRSCDGANAPYQVAALVFLAIATAAIVRLVVAIRRPG